MLHATILNLTRFFHEYYIHFYRIFLNKLFYYLVLSHKQLWYICLWNSRNRIYIFFSCSCFQYLLWTTLESAAPEFEYFLHADPTPLPGFYLLYTAWWTLAPKLQNQHSHTNTLTSPLCTRVPFFLILWFLDRIHDFLPRSSSNAFRRRHRVVQMKFEQLIQRYEASKHHWNES